MNISFDKHHLDFIKYNLKAGGYRNAAEIVREGLRLLEAQEELPSPDLEAEIIKGLDSGPARPFAPDYFDKLRKRLLKTKKRAA